MSPTDRENTADSKGEGRNPNQSVELLICFAFLIFAHVLVARKFLGVSYMLSGQLVWLKWIGVSGIGTIAVWFACSSRTFWQRITRFSIAVLLVYWLSDGQLYGFQLPIGNRAPAQIEMMQQASVRNLAVLRPTFRGSVPQSPRSVPWVITRQLFGTVNWTLVYWLLGSTLAASTIRMLVGFRLVAPDTDAKRKPASIWNLFMLLLVAAIASHLVRGEGWFVRLSYISNGATHAFIAIACAFLVFESKHTRRFGVPIAIFCGIVLMDIAGGGLLSFWSRNVASRMRYTAMFVLGLSASPMATFTLLRAYGYRSEHAWSKNN